MIWIAAGAIGAVVVVTLWAMLREGHSDKRPWASEFGSEAEDHSGHGREKGGTDDSSASDGGGGGDGD